MGNRTKLTQQIGSITLVKELQTLIPTILSDREALPGKNGVPDPVSFLGLLWQAANRDSNLVIPLSRTAMRREWVRRMLATDVFVKVQNGCRGIKVANHDVVRVALSCYAPKK